MRRTRDYVQKRRGGGGRGVHIPNAFSMLVVFGTNSRFNHMHICTYIKFPCNQYIDIYIDIYIYMRATD